MWGERKIITTMISRHDILQPRKDFVDQCINCSARRISRECFTEDYILGSKLPESHVHVQIPG